MSTPAHADTPANPYAVAYALSHEHVIMQSVVDTQSISRLFALSQAQLFFLSIDCNIEPLLQWI